MGKISVEVKAIAQKKVFPQALVLTKTSVLLLSLLPQL